MIITEHDRVDQETRFDAGGRLQAADSQSDSHAAFIGIRPAERDRHSADLLRGQTDTVRVTHRFEHVLDELRDLGSDGFDAGSFLPEHRVAVGDDGQNHFLEYTKLIALPHLQDLYLNFHMFQHCTLLLYSSIN